MSYFILFFLFFLLSFFKFYFIFKLYIIVLVLPNIKMNPPQAYMGNTFVSYFRFHVLSDIMSALILP